MVYITVLHIQNVPEQGRRFENLQFRANTTVVLCEVLVNFDTCL